MVLSDAQVDRFSRQIILPHIGGRGQERLLASAIAIAGDGEVAEIAALYLAGAGIGRITLHGVARQQLRADLLDLAPDTDVRIESGELAGATAEVLVACDVPLDELDRAAAAGAALIAGGAVGDHGWLVVAPSTDVCAGCGARAALRLGMPSRVPTPAAGVVGALISLAVVKLRLGLGGPYRRVWLQFDARHSTLTEHPLDRAAACPLCAERVDDAATRDRCAPTP